MRLSELRIQNFRAIKDETINFNDYTCFVGPNGSGKSTIFTALSVLFRYPTDGGISSTALDREDFHGKDISTPVIITCTFRDLPETAQRDFANYFRNDRLIISARAEWNAGSANAPVKQFGLRMVCPDFAPFFKAEADGAKVDELRGIYSTLKASHDVPPVTTKAAMLESLRNYEEAHPELLQPLESADEFYGFSGKGLLRKYVEWVFVPAVKDVSTEGVERKATALALLLERTVRTKLPFDKPMSELRQKVCDEYHEILKSQQSALTELSRSLESRIQQWAHPGVTLRLEWHSDVAKAISLADPLARMMTAEGPFEGQISRFGHGLQRSLLLSLLQELSLSEEASGPTLLLACEEPELFQHPPQIKHLASVFQSLSGKNSQVMICTHNPHFIKGHGFEDVRLTRRSETGESTVREVTLDQLSATIEKATGKRPKAKEGVTIKIAQALQPGLNEMFFTSVLILVEGLEDSAYLATYMALTDRWEEFRQFGCHIVPAHNKSNLIRPLAIAKEFRIPTFVIFDGDADKCGNKDKRNKHEIENRALLRLCNLDDIKPIPEDTLWTDRLVMWRNDIGDAIKSDVGEKMWLELNEGTRNEHDLNDVPDLTKNSVFIAQLLAFAWSKNVRFPTLDRVCKSVIDFASSHGAGMQMGIRKAKGSATEVKQTGVPA